MSRAPDYLYQLLPYVHRMRDEEQGFPLRALLRVITEQVNVVEEDVARLYENWFIETCDDWVVPYLGDLVGYRPVSDAGPSARASRREVANTISLRRRKGTLALLELLAQDVAGWPARAVEFYTLLARTQHLRHIRMERGRTVDLRNGAALDLLGGPFESTAHTIDVRRVGSARTQGRYNIPSVGLFVWRLNSYPVTLTPACCVEQQTFQGYTFSVLGNDTPLYARPQRETEPTHIAEEINLPVPIRRRAFELRAPGERRGQASPDWYGPDASLSIFAGDWPSQGTSGLVAAEQIIPADLSDWHAYGAPHNKVLVDPVRGRMVFPAGEDPSSVAVCYRYAFSADMGGGEYPRLLSQPDGARVYTVRSRGTAAGEFETIGQALEQWNVDKQTPGRRAAVVEIADSGVYAERIAISMVAGESLQLRAASMARPVLRMLDYRVDHRDTFSIRGGAGSRFTLDGLLVSGSGVEIGRASRGAAGEGEICDVRIRHCTLVPGWSLGCDCEPLHASKPSIALYYTSTRLVVEHSIVGPIVVAANEKRSDPAQLEISDSIVDATSEDSLAIRDAKSGPAFVRLSVARSTVIGAARVHALGLAENTILMGVLEVMRRQHGCLRFCYLTPFSRTPRRYHCQPDLALQVLGQADPPLPPAQLEHARLREPARVRPRFNSLRYGTPAYCQLAQSCAPEIVRGADDESEMGAFHDLYQPQRAVSLRTRLDEFTPAGSDAGIIFAS
jgi:hypothetical protein